MLFKWSLCFLVALAIVSSTDAVTKCRPKTSTQLAAPTDGSSSIPSAGSQPINTGNSQSNNGNSQPAASQPAGSQAGSQPAASQPDASQPASSQANSQAGSQPAASQPAASQPAGSQAGSQPAASQPAASQPAGSQAGSQPAASQPAASQPAGSQSYNSQTSSNNQGSQPSTGPYSIVDNWSGNNFFDGWEFYSGPDPTHGSVEYVDQPTAQSSGLVSVTSSGQVIMRADNTTTGNRKSVRINTQKTYTGGLFVLDLVHLPVGTGTWPAWWTFGPNWPNSGEIDILEGVSNSPTNQYTLHTGNQNGGCVMPVGDCYGNMGCDIKDSRSNSFGDALNQGGGGVFAMLWNDDAIQMWFFPRGSVPDDLNNGLSPDPSGWSAPVASFPNNPSCNIASNFANHQIIINLTFCGDWAGAVVPDCVNQVMNNPSQYSDAYWLINYVRTFQKN